MDASWQPDPTARHEYRWWDGSAWSSSVSDGGVISEDPPVGAPAPGPGGLAAPSGPAVAGPAPESPPASAKRGRRRGLVVLLAVIALAVIVAGVVYTLVAGGDDEGDGTDTEGEVEEGGSYLVDTLDLEAGDVVRVRIEPDDDLDAKIVVLVTEDMADEEAEVYAELLQAGGEDVDVATVRDEYFGVVPEELEGDAADEYEDLVVTLTSDDGVEGEPDATFFPALTDGTYTIVGASYAGDGVARMIVEVGDDRLDLDRDLEEMYSGDAFQGDFFDERSFYESSRPYEAG